MSDFLGSDNPQDKKRSEAFAAWKREQERQANDEIKVYNPGLDDFENKVAGNIWVIPHKDKDIGFGSGINVLPRFAAKLYAQRMIDQIINELNVEIKRKAKIKREGYWAAAEQRIEKRTDDPELRRKYMKIVWLGLHRAFGKDEAPAQVDKKDIRDKKIPLDEALIDELEKAQIPNEVKAPQKPSKEVKEQFADKLEDK